MLVRRCLIGGARTAHSVRDEGLRGVHLFTRSFALVLAATLIAGCAQGTQTAAPEPSPTTGGLAAASPSTETSPTATPTPEPTPAPTPTPDPTATPTPTPAPTPTPWLAYKSKRFHYKITYPPTWIVTPGSAKRSDLFDDARSTWVYVDRDTIRTGTVSLGITQSNQIAYYKSHYKAKLLTKKSLKVAGWPARLLTFRGTDDGQKLYIQVLFVAKGRAGYFLRMFTFDGNRKADQALFKKIWKTFRRT